MAPRRRVITQLGERLRSAREALHLDQVGLAQRIFVSPRQVSRWENGGGRPSAEQAQRLVDLVSPAPAPVREALAVVLGVELAEDEEEAPAEVAPSPVPPVPEPSAPPPPPPPPVPPRPAPAQLRAAFDAIIYAAAEDRDVLPRHLRAFAVDLLLQGADRLGVSAKEAAVLVAMPERSGGGRE